MNDQAWTQDTFWVVRSAGERTVAACTELIRSFVPAHRVVQVEERPFAKAIDKTFRLAAASGCEWTFCIDADVFVHAEGMRQLYEIAAKVPDNVWFVQGLTVDKFIPIIRTAGTGIYRSKVAGMATIGIPEDGTALRPEDVTRRSMLTRGYQMYRTPIVVGLHDFEQYYHDIARKTFLHYHKHHTVRPEMQGYWRSQQAQDADFRAALLGAELGESFADNLLIDREFKRQEIAAGLERIGLAPKEPLAPGAIDADYVTHFLETYRPDTAIQQKKYPQYTDYQLMYPWLTPQRRFVNSLRRLKQRLTR
ncbi:hypothetical protein [Neolewinella sp.]|uniref:hypothetical protein n=1 Tax=Neolewinella sp. TaxID=2993543 RepID=UPI003B52FB9A